MESSEKRYIKLKEDLNKANQTEKITIIKGLRKETIFPGVILLLKEIMENDINEFLYTEISIFLNDLKDQRLTEEVIEAINSTNNDIVQQRLIASCWHSGLDYSSYLGRFVEYSANLSYLSALECYSVIEEWANNCSPEDRNSWKKSLSQKLDKQNIEKRNLIEAIISLL